MPITTTMMSKVFLDLSWFASLAPLTLGFHPITITRLPFWTIKSKGPPGFSRLPMASFATFSSSPSALAASTTGTFSSVDPVARDRATLPVCIVGGGLAGLATAAALSRIARLPKLVVLERMKEEEFTCPTNGAAIQLGPNGLLALQAIGGQELVQRVQEAGTRLVANAVFLPHQSDPIKISDTTTQSNTHGLSQVLIRWSKLRDLLREALPLDSSHIEVRTGVDDILGYTIAQDGSRVSLLRASLDTDEQARDSDEYRFVVAADGIYSTFGTLMRQKMDDPSHANGRTITMSLPNDPQQASTLQKANILDGGRVNLKAVVPMNLIDLNQNIPQNDTFVFEPGTTYSFFAGTTACFAGPAGDGYTYWAISIADEKDGTSFLRDILQQNANSSTRKNEYNDEDCDDFEQTEKSSIKSKLLETLKGLEQADKCQFAIQLIQHTDPQAIFVARSEERQIGSSLVSPDGSAVVLVGDAAHAMSPAYGVSASFAFEDAATLADCVRENGNQQPLPHALARYSQLRLERCREMQRRSAERTARATKGESTEDISSWIYNWSLEDQKESH